jgi:Tol biopolymer transport system component
MIARISGALFALAGGLAALALGLGAALPRGGVLALPLHDPRHDTTDIFLLDMWGGRQINLTRTPTISERSPTWSHDGERLAFVAFGFTGNSIDALHLNGRREALYYTNLYNGDLGGVTWSPSGEWIAFIFNAVDGRGGVYAVNAGCLNTAAPCVSGEERAIISEGGFYYHLSWSPDGRSVLFVAERDRNADVYRAEADCLENLGGCHNQARRLTHDVNPDYGPSWSPDGGEIAFSSVRSGEYEMYLMAADGGEVRLLARYPVYIPPAWSPDGRSLAFPARLGHEYNLYRLDIDCGNSATLCEVMPLTGGAGNNLFPAWSPDGTHLSFVSTRTGSLHLYVMDTRCAETAGCPARRLALQMATQGGAVWQP